MLCAARCGGRRGAARSATDSMNAGVTGTSSPESTKRRPMSGSWEGRRGVRASTEETASQIDVAELKAPRGAR